MGRFTPGGHLVGRTAMTGADSATDQEDICAGLAPDLQDFSEHGLIHP
jgi:hypothetical protein